MNPLNILLTVVSSSITGVFFFLMSMGLLYMISPSLFGITFVSAGAILTLKLIALIVVFSIASIKTFLVRGN